MQTDMLIRSRSGSPGIPVRPAGALARLMAMTEAPVIGLAGTGDHGLTMGLLADMLRAGGRNASLGIADSLHQAAGFGLGDRVLIELGTPMLRQVPQGLSTLVLSGLAPDALAPGQAMADAVDELRRAIAGAGDCVVVNADDARALALAAEARVEVLRVASADRHAEAWVRAGELVLVDPLVGIERRVCRLDDCAIGATAYRSSLLLASAVAVQIGVEVEAIRAAACAFRPRPGQLDRLESGDRLVWIDGSSAIRPGPAADALRSIAGRRTILSIAGGRHGGQSLERWARASADVSDHTLIFGSGAEALCAALLRAGASVVRCADLDDAVASARHLASAGQSILFAPACDADDLDSPRPSERFRALVTLSDPIGASAEAA